MSFFKKINFSLFGLILIQPPVEMGQWKIERYSQIPKNEFIAHEEGLLIQVNQSASPLIRALNSIKHVYGFKVKGNFSALPQMDDFSKQGDKRHDDFPLRIGFIVPGEKTLSGFRRLFAPQWIKNLFQLAPKGMGIDSVQFFTVTQNKNHLGQIRTHPSSELIAEHFIHYIDDKGDFSIEYRFPTPLQVVAVWIATDGDHTHSKFNLLIKHLEIYTKDDNEDKNKKDLL